VSDKSSRDKIDLLKSMGAEVHVCPANVPPEDPRSYYEVAKAIHRKTENSVYINQYFNELNIEAHYRTTGPEIWEQTDGKITHLVVASGTGGTISGSGKYLKEQNPNVKVLGVDAIGSVLKKYHETKELDLNEVSPYKIEGLGKNLIPTATDFDVIDVYEKVSDKDAALEARSIVKKEGMFPGYTCGAVMQATKQYAAKNMFAKDSFVVLIFPDHGSRYMNKIYSDEWMKQNDFF
jgi:cystathionine beta-synthase